MIKIIIKIYTKERKKNSYPKENIRTATLDL